MNLSLLGKLLFSLSVSLCLSLSVSGTRNPLRVYCSRSVVSFVLAGGKEITWGIFSGCFPSGFFASVSAAVKLGSFFGFNPAATVVHLPFRVRNCIFVWLFAVVPFFPRGFLFFHLFLSLMTLCQR
jgi:hypothetical protein